MKKHHPELRLAQHAHDGQVYTCSRCRQIHLAWKNLVVGMTPGEFLRFAQMTQTAAEHPAFGSNGNGRFQIN